jgi:hypothetical protein
MNLLYRYLVWVDRQDFEAIHYESVWNDFKPQQTYKLGKILLLLLFGFAYISWEIGELLLAKPLKWLNDHVTVTSSNKTVEG